MSAAQDGRSSGDEAEIVAKDPLVELRKAFGCFATGVTIITTTGADDEPIGVTANSFNSMSLQPPMVLWSLSEDAFSRRAFERAEHFCVNVLNEEQRDLSERFASRGADKFRDVRWSNGAAGIPVLHDCVARFHCRTESRYEVGDHTLYIGEVLEFDYSDQRPLLFFGGQYAHADRRLNDRDGMLNNKFVPYRIDRRQKRPKKS